MLCMADQDHDAGVALFEGHTSTVMTQASCRYKTTSSSTLETSFCFPSRPCLHPNFTSFTKEALSSSRHTFLPSFLQG